MDFPMQQQSFIMETQNLCKLHAFASDMIVVLKSLAWPILEPDKAARNIIQTQKLYKVDAMTA
jgi:hypothetical protein